MRLISKKELVLKLFDIGAIQFGTFTLSSGKQSPIYIDLRLLQGHPDFLFDISRLYAKQISRIEFDRLAGVPHAATVIAAAVSLKMERPMITPRLVQKKHGKGNQIDGPYKDGDTVLVVEDLITSGGSIIKVVEILRNHEFIVTHAVVLLDRMQGGWSNLANHGIDVRSVTNLREVITILLRECKITQLQYDEIEMMITD